MKLETQIKKAKEKINSNSELTFGYREDVTAVMDWVLDKGGIDGL